MKNFTVLAAGGDVGFLADDLTPVRHRERPMQIQRKSLSDVECGTDLRSLMVWPTIVSRTIPLTGRHAKLRLENAIWSGLDEIAKKQKRLVPDLCQEVDSSRPATMPLTSAIRSYVLDYFRQAGTR